MKQTLIKITNDHYVVVDDSEIKEGDYYFSKISDNMFRRIKDGHWIENYDKKMYKKITHSTQPFEDVGLNTSMGNQLGFDKIEPIYLSEVKELIGEVDVEKEAEISSELQEGTYTPQHKITYKHGYQDGYNQSLEDNKDKKYTEDDMINWTMCMIAQYVQGNTNIWNKDLLRKSLPTPKTQWEVTFDEQGKLRLV